MSIRPLRIVAFGGGTGLPVLLEGVRDRADMTVAAVAAVGDDGGSSGRLRRALGVAPPGDLRNCLAALAGDRELAAAFGHRFDAGELGGHPLGNLIVAGLESAAGDLCTGVEWAGRALQVRGAVYPAAREGLVLMLHTADGCVLAGESLIEGRAGALARVEVAGRGAAAPDRVLAEIRAADAVVLAPGSLFTSTIAALLGGGTREALSQFRGPVVYAANLVEQPGETSGFTAADHVRAILAHAGPRVTHVIAPATPPRAVGAVRVQLDEARLRRLGADVLRVPRLASASGERHDPARLAAAVAAALAGPRATAVGPG